MTSPAVPDRRRSAAEAAAVAARAAWPSSTGSSAAASCPGAVLLLGRRAGRRQVDAAARGRGQGRPARRTARSTSPARSPRPRCGCAPSAPAPSRTSLYLAAEVDLSAVLGHIEAVEPDLLVIDSIQTIASSDIDGVAGGVTQVRAVTAALVRVAKERHLPTLLVGHVTKDGSIAGPRALEHIVDVVLQFEGERNSRLRVLRAVKNRFGPVDEIGCFDLGRRRHRRGGRPERALRLRGIRSPTSGTCVTVTLEGRRPLIGEVQALVTPTPEGSPRRAVSGLDSSRLSMLHRRARAPCRHAAAAHATSTPRPSAAPRCAGPATDLAVAVALVIATRSLRLPTTPSRSARSGWPASCAASRAWPSGWPRRPGSASPAPSSRPVRRCVRAAAERSPDSTVIECPDLWSALVRARSRSGPAPAYRPTPTTSGSLTTLIAQHHRARGGPWQRGQTDTDARLRATLAAVAPGHRAARGTGAHPAWSHRRLVVLGHDKTVESICTGGFLLDIEFTADRSARAGQDGRRDRLRPRRAPGSSGPAST